MNVPDWKKKARAEAVERLRKEMKPLAEGYSTEAGLEAKLIASAIGYVLDYIIELEAPVKSYPGRGHPWGDFLHHRARAMRWMRDEEKKNPTRIAIDLCMDPSQVEMILSHVDAHPEEYEP